MEVGQAGIQDAGEILELQRLAYQSEAAIYSDYTIPPLIQTLAELEQDFQRQVFLKVRVEGRIIGSVRAFVRNGTCFIGRLIVHPEYQNRGVGTRLMAAVENHFIGVRRYELFTGHKSERNLYLYGKLGYRLCRTEPLSDRVTTLVLEKAGEHQ